MFEGVDHAKLDSSLVKTDALEEVTTGSAGEEFVGAPIPEPVSSEHLAGLYSQLPHTGVYQLH